MKNSAVVRKNPIGDIKKHLVPWASQCKISSRNFRQFLGFEQADDLYGNIDNSSKRISTNCTIGQMKKETNVQWKVNDNGSKKKSVKSSLQKLHCYALEKNGGICQLSKNRTFKNIYYLVTYCVIML